MRKVRYLAVGWVALVLVSCGGVHKGYEGPVRDVKEIAVLKWSMCEKCRIFNIDGNGRRRRLSDIVWVSDRNQAHLLPGPYTIAVATQYKDLWKCVLLDADFHLGRSYVMKQTACFECDPFEATIRIEDMVSGAIIAQSTVVSTGSYGEAGYQEEQCIERNCIGMAEQNRNHCEVACWPFDSESCRTRPATLKITPREIQDGNLLATLKVRDQRPPGLATTTFAPKLRGSLDTIRFDPPEAQVVKNFLEVELTRILRQEGIQSRHDFFCNLLEFYVRIEHGSPYVFYSSGEVTARIRLLLKHNGKEYDLSGKSTRKIHTNLGTDIIKRDIKRVVDGALEEIAADLEQYQARFMQGL